MAILVPVARSAAENDTGNAIDVRRILVDRVEAYFRNETYAAESLAALNSEENEAELTEAIRDRDIVPLDSDDVRLYAVVWAKAKGEAEFKPYCREAFHNDGSYYCTGTKFGPSIKTPSLSAQHKLEEMYQEKLDPALVSEVLAWPEDWPGLEFTWEELPYDGESAGTETITRTNKDGDEKDVTVKKRKFKYLAAEAFLRDEGDDGWTHDLFLYPGTRRFRVKFDLPEGVRHRKSRSRTKLSSCSDSRRNTGKALRLSVRQSIVAEGRTPELTEMIRWCTAFVFTPYENGGHWMGGQQTSSDHLEKNGYQGFGMDCSGFLSSAAQLAGILYDTFRRGTLRQNRPFPGQQIEADELEPGDLIDFTGHSHVQLVFQTWSGPDPDDPTKVTKWASWIECSGSKEGVFANHKGQPAKGIVGYAQLVRLDKMDPR